MRAARGCNRCIIHTSVLAKKVGGARAPSAPLVPTPMSILCLFLILKVPSNGPIRFEYIGQ